MQHAIGHVKIYHQLIIVTSASANLHIYSSMHLQIIQNPGKQPSFFTAEVAEKALRAAEGDLIVVKDV